MPCLRGMNWMPCLIVNLMIMLKCDYGLVSKSSQITVKYFYLLFPINSFSTHWMDKDNFLDNFRNHSILWISWNRKSRNNNMTSLWFVFKIVWQCLCTTPIIHRFEWKLFRQLHVIYWTGGAIKDLLDLIIQWMTSQIWLYYTYDIFGAFGNIWYIIILLS